MQFVRSSQNHPGLESKYALDLPLDGQCHRSWILAGSLGDDIAALQVGAHILESDGGEELAQGSHADPVVTADVDGAKECNERIHRTDDPIVVLHDDGDD